MREIINQILEGNFDYEKCSLDFSCAKLELTIRRGEVCEGSFYVYSEPGCYTEGSVISSDLRMECLTSHFVGENEEISYCFHGEYMEEGDVVKGNFCIVSNCGEYYLPFVVTVEHVVLESSIGSVKNLFHFANLAKSNWREAVGLFYTPGFARVLEGNDSLHYDSYRGLSVYPGNEQNVEEFLISVNKKQKVDFIVREDKLTLDIAASGTGYAVLETELNLVRNGWGYTSLQVECEGDFVFTEKEFLTDDDFLGNRCRLPVFIDVSLCRPGRNFGRVYIYNSYISLTIPVVVQMGDGTVSRRTGTAYKKNIARLMEMYLAFRMKQTGMEAWLKDTKELVEHMVTADENDIAARLFQAQLLIFEESYNEGMWVLDYVEGRMEKSGEQDSTMRAYFLYLTTLVNREEEYTERVTSQVEHLLRQERDNWRIAWLLLYLSEEYNKSAAAKWALLEKQFELGCTSPILYIEALNLLNGNPTFLRKLERYQLQVLHFGARHGALNPAVLEQILYLSAKGKDFSPILLKILVTLYEKNQDVRILQEICSLLIRGNRVGNEYYDWYRAGVENKLRITNLYEYYMMSVDLQTVQQVPKTVLMYFSYQNNLDYERRAFLYYYAHQNRAELGELYDTYRPVIELFVLEQIQKEHINRHLAGLYQEFLTPAMINEQTAEHLARLMFAHQVNVEDRRLKKVIVYQAGNRYSAEYPIQDQTAWVVLYGNDYTVLFEDAYGNRFARSADYTLERLMIPGKNLRLVGNLVQDSPEFDLYLCWSERDIDKPEDMDRALRVAESEITDGALRRQLYLKLLRYYYDADDMRMLDTCLDRISGEDLTMEDRSGVLRYMVLRNKMDAAWEWIQKYGPYFADSKALMRLVSEMIARNDGMEDAYLVSIARYTFRHGKYDGRILQYLVDYAQGTTKELRDVWKAGCSFDLDCRRLSERILEQILYSGAFVGERMDIFQYYVAHVATAEVEEAFLIQCSYDYFVRERLTESIVFSEIRRMYLCGEEVQRICKLAYLKYYSENTDEITPDILRTIGDFLQEMIENRIHLNIFRSFAGMDFPQEHLLRELADKTIVEYCASPGARARIHYVVQRGEETGTEYLTETMREVYAGVCFKDFVLFFGESLQYYIVEETDGEEQLTESGNLQKNDIRGDGENWRYGMINDIAISSTLQDYDTLDSLVEEYYHREYLYRELFRLM